MLTDVIDDGDQRYYPFGESRTTTTDLPTDKLFTGQQQDSYIKLYQMGARWYDPAIGRFISADTIVPNSGNPQSLNRYSYGYNNPVKYRDPSGHAACYDSGVEIGSGISQADCWAYGRDKWIYGMPVAAPMTGQGYNTGRALEGGLTQTTTNNEGTFNRDLFNIYKYQGGEAAVNWIAKQYGINLPPGYKWGFLSGGADPAATFCNSLGCTVGWNPIDDQELGFGEPYDDNSA